MRLKNATFAASRWANLEPANPNAQLVAISLLIKNKQPTKAHLYLKQLINIDTPQKTSYFILLVSQMETPEQHETLYQLTQAMPPVATSAHIYAFIKALTAESAGHYDVALSHIEVIRQLQPDWVQAIALQIRLFRKTKTSEQTLSFLEQTLTDYPHLEDLHWLQAEMLFEAQLWDKAQLKFSQLTENPLYQIDSLIFLGKIAAQQKRWDEAYNYYNQVLSLDSAHDGAFYYLGVTAQQQDNLSEALAQFTQV